MDSLSHIALGAAVGVAVMGRRTAVWKAALWGAVAGNLPDLDVLIDHGDAVRNMVLHRAETHAPFWLSLFSLPFAAAVAKLHGESALWKRWWLAIWLALVTHTLLDAMTVYGTQLALPFSSHPYGVGSIFIIDLLYTVPLLLGVGWALRSGGAGRGRGRAANFAGLVISSAYLAWGVAAQVHVEGIARGSLAAQGIAAEQVLVTPTAFNTVLWRIVAIDGERFHEGFYSLFDAEPRVVFDPFVRGTALAADLDGIAALRRVQAFSKGFYKLQQQGERIVVSDLRMGQEPTYAFSFVIAERHSPPVALARPEQIGMRPDLQRGLPWLWRRALGEALPPPR